MDMGETVRVSVAGVIPQEHQAKKGAPSKNTEDQGVDPSLFGSTAAESCLELVG